MAYEELYIEMGKRVRERRKELRLTQDQLAEKADVSAQMISYVENGSKAIRPENLIKISQALNISCDYILTGKNGYFDLSYFVNIVDSIDLNSIDTYIELFNLLKRLKSY